MSNPYLKSLLAAGYISTAIVGTASAGGFDRGGIGIDLLFDESRFATDAGVTYINPQRKLKNVQRLDGNAYGPLGPVPQLFSSSVKVGGDFVVPRFGIKVNIVEPVDCLGTYTEPYGADADYGTGNAYSVTSSEFKVDTKDFGLTCSYKMKMGKGVARLIGGVSYQEVDALQARQTLLPFGNTGVGVFKLSDDAWSWRVGAAYEIPEIAFRASLVYSARYSYDLKGTVNTEDFAGAFPANLVPGSTGIYPVSASTEIPQALDLRIQSGIAPNWLAFGSIRWQEWSKLQSIPIIGVRSPVVGGNPLAPDSNSSFDPFYQDGWTITGGVGHKFTDQISGAASVTWDRGTSTISGYQSDTWTFAAGGSYTPTKNLEFRLGGSLGVLTSGTSLPAGTDVANLVTYEYGNDLVAALSGSLKLKF
jgi:long-chain fatty acid transport protein